MVRVIVADDDLIVREGIAALLSTEADLEVVARCADADEVRAAVAASPADVVLTDIRMPPTRTDEGVRLAVDLLAAHPGLGVVVLSQYLDPAFALTLLGDGDDRRGYLLKERVGDADQLAGAVRTVAAGGSWVDPAVVESLMAGRSSRRVADDPLAALTAREREILAEVAAGKSNAAIAATVFLSERSVEKHVASILLKLGITDDAATNRRVKAALAWLAGAGRV